MCKTLFYIKVNFYFGKGANDLLKIESRYFGLPFY